VLNNDCFSFRRNKMLKKPEDQVACPSCSLAVTRRNLSRHCRVVHGSTETSAMSRAVYATPDSRSRSSSRDSRDRAGSSSGSTLTSTSSHVLMEAAAAVLDQHHSFTEAQLITYLAECYPEVPEEYRRPLVLGAVAGAQRAARMYIIVEKNRNSQDENKRGMAANSACTLSFWNLGLRTPSRTPSSRSSSMSAAPATVVSETPPVLISMMDLAGLQLPVSLQQSNRDLEEMQQAILCQGTSYEVVAAAPPDASLLVPISATSAPETTDASQDVEPYVPPVLPGSLYADMPYIPSAIAQQPSPTAFDTEPSLLISAPADPTLYEPEIDREEQEEAKKEKEEAKKKEEEAEPKKTELESKKKEELLAKKKEEAEPKKTEQGSKKKEELMTKKKDAVESKKREGDAKRNEESKRRREEVRDKVPPTERRTSPRRALLQSTSRDQSPRRTVSSWEWREFVNYRRRCAVSHPPFRRHKKDH